MSFATASLPKKRLLSDISHRRPSFCRAFHDYFVSHLPSTSLHPDSRAASGPGHQLPRSASKPHEPKSDGPQPAPLLGPHTARDTTVVRIPLRSAKYHFGAAVSRGGRPYNEDAYQAGVIDLPAFTKRRPVTLSSSRAPAGSPLQQFREAQQRRALQEQNQQSEGSQDGEGPAGEADPQVFYFGVFDGHGGAACSGYLREKLHKEIEDTAKLYHLHSTLKPASPKGMARSGEASPAEHESISTAKLIEPLLKSYREMVGGYFRRFRPTALIETESEHHRPTITTVLTHAFLNLDLTFLLAQLRLSQQSQASEDLPINRLDSLNPIHASSDNIMSSRHPNPVEAFRGGSTASVALISTPTPVPFWHPSTASTLVTAHVGDTRILLSRVSDGAAVGLTTNHHPSTPSEASRLRRWATSFVTDSFGEERLTGLANTRAFGDMGSKRMGVCAEPEVQRLDLGPSEYAFMVLISDGVSGVMSDQEIVDVIKEAKTPELAARGLVNFATDMGAQESDGADNATAIVVRMGGWERRNEGGGGSLRTREEREWRRREASEGRRGMQ